MSRKKLNNGDRLQIDLIFLEALECRQKQTMAFVQLGEDPFNLHYLPIESIERLYAEQRKREKKKGGEKKEDEQT